MQYLSFGELVFVSAAILQIRHRLFWLSATLPIVALLSSAIPEYAPESDVCRGKSGDCSRHEARIALRKHSSACLSLAKAMVYQQSDVAGESHTAADGPRYQFLVFDITDCTGRTVHNWSSPPASHVISLLVC